MKYHLITYGCQMNLIGYIPSKNDKAAQTLRNVAQILVLAAIKIVEEN